MHARPLLKAEFAGLVILLAADGSVRELIEHAERLVEVSRITDRRLSVVLTVASSLIVLIAATLASRVFICLAFSSYSECVLLVHYYLPYLGLPLFVAIVYILIRRRNDHFQRSLRLFEVFTRIAEKLGFKRASTLKLRLEELRRASGSTRHATVNAMFAVLAPLVLPVVYTFNFLNKDFARHSQAERKYLEELAEELRECCSQLAVEPKELALVPRRSTLLYTLLSILTAGLFLVYWVYTLTVDPNRHFESHQLLERKILEALKEVGKKVARDAERV